MSDKKNISMRNKLLIVLIGISQGIIFMMPYISSTFYKPLQETLGCTNAQIGFLVTIYGIPMIVGALPGGWLADRFDPKKLMVLGLLMNAIAVLFLAFFASYPVYLAMWLLMSIGGNVLFYMAQVKVTNILGGERAQGTAFGVSHFCRRMSVFCVRSIGLFFVGSELGAVMGFKYFIILTAIILFILTGVIWKLLPDKLSEKQESGEANSKLSLREYGDVLKNPCLWLYTFVVFGIYSGIVVNAYFTPFYTDVLQLNVAAAGGVYAIMSPLGAFFAMVLGVLCDKVGSNLKVMAATLILPSIALLVLLMSDSMTLTEAIVIHLICGLSIEGLFGIIWSAFREIKIDGKAVGSAVGVVSLLGFTPDLFMWTMFGGWIDTHSNGGYSMIFLSGAVLYTMAIVLCIILLRVTKKVKTETINEH